MKILTLFILILISPCINAQVNENNFDPKKIKSRFLPLPAKSIEQISPAFSIKDIEILDGRFDSSVGYIKHAGTGEYLNLKIKTTDEIRDYLLSNFINATTDTPYRVLCVLRKLILSNNIYVVDEEKDQNAVKNTDAKSGTMIKLDFFVEMEGRFIPLYRFDSTITGTRRISIESAPEYLSQSLSASLKKLTSIPWISIKMKGKRYSRAAIDSSIVNAFALSRYQTPVKGVYNTFSDFLNNKPNTNEYSIVRTGKADFLYTKDSKNTEVLRTDIWGYCDGKNFYVYSAENFFQLHPTGKTFIIYGAKDYKSSRVLRIHFGLIDAIAPNSAYAKSKTRQRYSLIHETLILDMETGELF